MQLRTEGIGCHQSTSYCWYFSITVLSGDTMQSQTMPRREKTENDDPTQIKREMHWKLKMHSIVLQSLVGSSKILGLGFKDVK